MISEDHCQAIDMQAVKCCRRMNEDERREFFNGSIRDSSVGHDRNHLHYTENYTRGPRAGTPRAVFAFDERELARLWRLVTPEVMAYVAQNFAGHQCEDSVSAVLEKLFYILRFEGPVPHNHGFSIAMLVVMQSGANGEIRRQMAHKSQIIIPCGQLNDDLFPERTSALGRALNIDDTTCEAVMFGANSIEPDIEAAIEQMLGDEKLYTVAKFLVDKFPNAKTPQVGRELAMRYIRREVTKLLSDDGGPMTKVLNPRMTKRKLRRLKRDLQHHYIRTHT